MRLSIGTHIQIRPLPKPTSRIWKPRPQCAYAAARLLTKLPSREGARAGAHVCHSETSGRKFSAGVLQINPFTTPFGLLTCGLPNKSQSSHDFSHKSCLQAANELQLSPLLLQAPVNKRASLTSGCALSRNKIVMPRKPGEKDFHQSAVALLNETTTQINQQTYNPNTRRRRQWKIMAWLKRKPAARLNLLLPSLLVLV